LCVHTALLRYYTSFNQGVISSLTTMSTFVNELDILRTKFGAPSFYTYLVGSLVVSQLIIGFLSYWKA
jgi:fluoride ion exporter CrcB/FEX